MKLLASILALTNAYEQPKYEDFLRALNQKKTGWGAPTDRIASFHGNCPPLTAPENGKVVCDQATCALVCNQGFVAVGRRRTKCRFNNIKQFFWKRELGECKTCPDLAPPPNGIAVECKSTHVGKKKCIYTSKNEHLDIVYDATGERFGGIGATCTCPRWNNRVCGWNSPKLGGMITDADIAELRQQVPCDARSGADCPYSENFEERTNEIPSSLKTCKNNAPSSARIVGGTTANHQHWPWFARLHFSYDGEYVESPCGGSIIRDNWVVTAAHCCQDPNGDPDGVLAVFNDSNQNEFNPGEFNLTATSQNFFTHDDFRYEFTEEWSDSPTKPDLCLIKFDTSISAAGQGTSEICLANALPKHGKACWVAGFGTIGRSGKFVGEEAPLSPEFKSVGVSIMSRQYCEAKSQNHVIFGKYAKEDICAGLPDVNMDGWTDGAPVETYWDESLDEATNLEAFSNGLDSCQSDSGGPLVCDEGGVATLVGVVSRGEGCAWESFPGMYTSVAMDNWIEEIIANNPTVPPPTTQPPTTKPPTTKPPTTKPPTTQAPTTQSTQSSTASTPAAEEFEKRTNAIPSSLKTCSNNVPSSARIIGGIEANHQHWPWFARLYFSWGELQNMAPCGGSIIRDNWVVTAAHCCQDSKLGDADGVLAIFNDSNQFEENPGEFNLTATKIIPHPDYHHGLTESWSDSPTKPDLCLIQFDKSISAGGTGTREICLAESTPQHGKACWVGGFGKIGRDRQPGSNTDSAPLSPAFKSAGISIMSHDYCNEKSLNFNIFGPYAENDICAGLPDSDGDGQTDGAPAGTLWDDDKTFEENVEAFSAGVDACQSDSGGPLVCDEGGVATLVGVVSRGYKCAWEGFPGLYTSVATKLDNWIEATIASNPTSPPPTTAAPTTPSPTTQSSTISTSETGEFKTRTDNIPSTLKTCSDDQSSPARIVGGIKADHTQWPWYARLYMDFGGTGGGCGASIIHDNWVLTAAHCCKHYQLDVIADSITATFNDADQYATDPDEFIRVAPKENIFLHPGYIGWQPTEDGMADICLVKFDKSISSEGKGTREICVADKHPTHGDACWVAGFGKQGKDSPSTQFFKSAGVSIMNHEYCNAKSGYPQKGQTIRTYDICVGYPDEDGDGMTDGLNYTSWNVYDDYETNLENLKDGFGVCQGDSGGALVCNVDGVATVFGVASRVEGCGWKNYPSIFSAVAEAGTDDWIAQTIASNTNQAPTTQAPSTQGSTSASQASDQFQPRTDEIPSTLKTCSNNKPSPARIVGGLDQADHTHWPWFARLQLIFGDNAGGCGGSIIRDNWVVTAAHCCLSDDNEKADRVIAVFNDNDQALTSSDEFIRIAPKENIFVHPGWTSGPDLADLCLIKFDKSISSQGEGLTSEVCLADSYPKHGDACWIAGFGRIAEQGPQQGSRYLKSAGVSIMDLDYCNKHSGYPSSMMGAVKTYDICAGLPDEDGDGWTDGAAEGTVWDYYDYDGDYDDGKYGLGSCNGDSGGPLVCNVNGVATLFGVVSRTAREGGCGWEKWPTIYSSVAFDKWIETTIDSNA